MATVSILSLHVYKKQHAAANAMMTRSVKGVIVVVAALSFIKSNCCSYYCLCDKCIYK